MLILRIVTCCGDQGRIKDFSNWIYGLGCQDMVIVASGCGVWMLGCLDVWMFGSLNVRTFRELDVGLFSSLFYE